MEHFVQSFQWATHTHTHIEWKWNKTMNLVFLALLG